jgi:hypothetical protein
MTAQPPLSCPVTGPSISERAAVLAKHQGPFFNGTESRCLCGYPVASGDEWAVHVDQVLEECVS